MQKLSVQLTFFEPFRAGLRKEKSRFESYARWCKSNSGLWKPYIPGTLLRSAVLESVEYLLALIGSKNKVEICPGLYTQAENEQNPKYLRRRPWYELHAQKEICKTRDTACPLCLLMRTKLDNDGDGETEKNVKFGNLYPTSPLEPLQKIRPRILNRMDPGTSKARDYFRVFEIENQLCSQFRGWIWLSGDLPNMELVKSLLAAGLSNVATLAGAVCRIRIVSTDNPSMKQDLTTQDLIDDFTNYYLKGDTPPANLAASGKGDAFPRFSPGSGDHPDTTGVSHADMASSHEGTALAKDIAEKCKDILSQISASEQLRRLADIMRDLRQDSNREIMYRQVAEENHEKASLLYKKTKKGDSIAALIAGKTEGMDAETWRRLCEFLGQTFYGEAKEAGLVETPVPRILGESERYSLQKKPTVRTDLAAELVPDIEFIIKGNLIAETPFFFGTDIATETHTDLPILLTSDRHFRIPRSVLRGILRRDLRLVTGSGCSVKLGRSEPCACDVCQIMRSLTMRDCVSSCKVPPEIRHRIRLNPVTETVEEGALFDMEIGPQGISFPFVLRSRGVNSSFSTRLKNVLTWWSEGKIFMGGDKGTGKGRFTLAELEAYYFRLTTKRIGKNVWVIGNYLKSQGWRGAELETHFDSLKEWKSLSFSDSDVKVFPWHKITWKVSFEGPVLTNDPIAADIRNESDAVFYQKSVAGEKGPVYALKGEGLRGIVSSSLCKNKNLSSNLHEDCECLRCKIFGSKHQEGNIRFEDMTVSQKSEVREKLFDHVSIDRFTGGAANKLKFDDKPLVGNPLVFQGVFWVHQSIGNNEKTQEALSDAFKDVRDGLYPVGAKGSIGYGWIKGIEVVEGPDWLKDALSAEKTVEAGIASEESEYKLPDLPWISLLPKGRAIYNPHYFLGIPKVTPEREREPVGHDRFQTDLHTGRIICTLKTITPLIIPDTENDKAFEVENASADHERFKFMRMGSQAAIPGSAIRSMTSSVFEALTNSCFRVLDQKSHLSWRMEADDAGDYKPGRFEKKDDKAVIRKFKKKARFPFYAGPDTREAFTSDQIMGKEMVTLWVKDFEASLTVPDEIGWKKKRGYLKVTGPNKVEIDTENISENNPSPPDSWQDVRINDDGTIPDKKNRKFICQYGTTTYTVDKWCEAFFCDEEKDPYELAPDVERKYRLLMDSYHNNPQAPPQIFRSLPLFSETGPKKTLEHGDLVYFRLSEVNKQSQSKKQVRERVTDIVPVSISRIANNQPIGKHIAAAFRPCAYVCIEECEPCDAKTCQIPVYREGYPIKGLCRACHLFGTTGYKGRVRFSFAKLNGDAVWAKGAGGKDYFTLPLLEKPRPTWTMPNEGAKIPGRKFYVHHNEWKTVQEGKNPIDQKAIRPNPNNSSVEVLNLGNEFQFEVSFENLEEWELGLLLYCLELEPGLAHKLGRGKAFGFGSIEAEVSKIEMRIKSGTWKNETSGKEKFIQSGLSQVPSFFKQDEKQWNEVEQVKNIRKLLQLSWNKGNAVEPEVRYPALREKDDENKRPGYVELKDNGYDAGKKLVSPWSPWYPVRK